ncbi:hypothetical protein J23TS9_06610 [Paenibacillus sp. J23TS9]|uniref:hypothetical protein n=1 Tax=Paenibacillus sp. J23TS9 TaxID=2807193 RepID=UPI001B1BFED4|nr:hypothetical protein [Paenibacillus sp. J23TS9]GIP25531.1 hypothetical protein J23TS9_06610 [Paenibacillus sp. J23TS9]
MKDQPVLFYCKDGTLYPVALTAEQQQMFEMTVSLLSPLKVISGKPQGQAINLLSNREEQL